MCFLFRARFSSSAVATVTQNPILQQMFGISSHARSDARKMLCSAKDAAWDMDSDGGADDDLVADSSQMGDCEPSVALAALAGEAPRNDVMRTASPDRGARGRQKSISAAAKNTNTNTTCMKASSTFKCGICQRQRPLDEKVSGFTWDRECKRACDSLSRMAKKQGEESWWEKMKADLKKLKRTVTEYSRVFPASGRGTVRGKSFDVGGRVAGLHP